MSRERFVEIVTADQPDVPAYFTYDAVLNTRRAPYARPGARAQISTHCRRADFLARLNDGAQILDARDPSHFEGAHLRGSVNVGLGGSFATWCGTVLDRERPILLIALPGREAEAATRLGRIGFDNVGGYLDGGMQPLGDSPELIERIARITAPALAEQLVSENPPLLIDVRSAGEWRQERIGGAENHPLSQFPESPPAVERGRSAVAYCSTGYRSAIAASLIQRDGLGEVSDLVGGLAAWQSAKLPITLAA